MSMFMSISMSASVAIVAVCGFSTIGEAAEWWSWC
jgi:hypothetical protein